MPQFISPQRSALHGQLLLTWLAHRSILAPAWASLARDFRAWGQARYSNKLAPLIALRVRREVRGDEWAGNKTVGGVVIQSVTPDDLLGIVDVVTSREDRAGIAE